jgi:hypothetical protein
MTPDLMRELEMSACDVETLLHIAMYAAKSNHFRGAANNIDLCYDAVVKIREIVHKEMLVAQQAQVPGDIK